MIEKKSIQWTEHLKSNFILTKKLNVNGDIIRRAISTKFDYNSHASETVLKKKIYAKDLFFT